jgi:hypothetical protein
MCSPSIGSSKQKAVFENEPGQSSSSSHRTSPTVRRRISSKMRARIDIDDEIQEAAQISDMLKKVQKRAKSLQKSSKKAKQRLVLKASKLRAEDLERIAVLKRCGLFVHEHASNPNAALSEHGEPGMPGEATKTKVQTKLADIMSQTEGSAGLVHVLQRQYTAGAGTAPCESPIAGSVVHVPALIPTGTPLGSYRKDQSFKHVEESQEQAGQEDVMAEPRDLE